MSAWRIPEICELKHKEPPSAWIFVVAFVVVFSIGFIVTILNWKQGESIVSAKFFGFALGVPFLVWCAFCGLLLLPSEDWNTRADWWNYLVKDHFSDWRRWSQCALCILDTVTITPEPELAERMIGLDGSPPANGGKVLALQSAGELMVASKLEDVLSRLIAPFTDTLRRFTGKRTVQIALQTSDEMHLMLLRGVLQKLEIAHTHIVLSRHASDDVPRMLDEWMTSQTARDDYGGPRRKMMPDLCLMLACQLGESDAPPVSEAAVAMMFGSSKLLGDTSLKPQARLFRLMPTRADEMPDAIKTLVAAEPTPLKRLRNLWVSNLGRRDGHVVRACAQDSEPALTVIDLDQALGVPGRASPLLLQALATQAVQFGQGPQLVAMPDIEGLRLNLIGRGYAEVETVEAPDIDLWPFSYSAILGALIVLLEIAYIALDAGPGWGIGAVVVGALFVFVGLPLGTVLRHRGISREFVERARM